MTEGDREAVGQSSLEESVKLDIWVCVATSWPRGVKTTWQGKCVTSIWTICDWKWGQKIMGSQHTVTSTFITNITSGGSWEEALLLLQGDKSEPAKLQNVELKSPVCACFSLKHTLHIRRNSFKTERPPEKQKINIATSLWWNLRLNNVSLSSCFYRKVYWNMVNSKSASTITPEMSDVNNLCIIKNHLCVHELSCSFFAQ